MAFLLYPKVENWSVHLKSQEACLRFASLHIFGLQKYAHCLRLNVLAGAYSSVYKEARQRFHGRRQMYRQSKRMKLYVKYFVKGNKMCGKSLNRDRIISRK